MWTFLSTSEAQIVTWRITQTPRFFVTRKDAIKSSTAANLWKRKTFHEPFYFARRRIFTRRLLFETWKLHLMSKKVLSSHTCTQCLFTSSPFMIVMIFFFPQKKIAPSVFHECKSKKVFLSICVMTRNEGKKAKRGWLMKAVLGRVVWLRKCWSEKAGNDNWSKEFEREKLNDRKNWINSLGKRIWSKKIVWWTLLGMKAFSTTKLEGSNWYWKDLTRNSLEYEIYVKMFIKTSVWMY